MEKKIFYCIVLNFFMLNNMYLEKGEFFFLDFLLNLLGLYIKIIENRFWIGM